MSHKSVVLCAVSGLLFAAPATIGSTLTITGTYQGTYIVSGMSGPDFLLESQQSSQDSSLGLNSLTAQWAVTLGTSNVVHDGSATFSALSGDLLFASFNGASVQVSNFQLGNLALTFTGGTGLFAGASGTADVSAKLVDNGLASGTLTGTITGTVQVIPEPSASPCVLVVLGLLGAWWALKKGPAAVIIVDEDTRLSADE